MSHAKVVVVGCLASLALVLAACSNSPAGSNRSQGATSSGSSGNSGGEAQTDIVKSCEADYKVLEVALAAYEASVGSNAVPPAPWSESTYVSNFSPLTSSSVKQGPFLHNALDPQDYVIEYDAQGNVWIEPTGTYDTSYNAKHAASDKVCESILQ
ncbi:MAG TPA: hypothetical protein VIY26_02845 [Acidimicrobiales bacterium]